MNAGKCKSITLIFWYMKFLTNVCVYFQRRNCIILQISSYLPTVLARGLDVEEVGTHISLVFPSCKISSSCLETQKS